MAAKPWLSIRGLYHINPNLFSEMIFPEGIDGDVLIDTILEECAELEILFPDPDYMQTSLARWSRVRAQAWQKTAEVLAAEYNPIWNKDGKITETYDYGKLRSSGEGRGYVSGYNSESLVNSNRTTSETNMDAHQDKHERIEQGNIGVTESSAMVQHELDLRRGPTVYDIITTEFKLKYCLYVY